MLVRLQGTRRTSQSALAWMLGFVFLPFAAIPLFLLFGSRKFPTRAKKPEASLSPWSKEELAGAPKHSRVLSGSVVPPRPGHSFELLGDGERAFARLIELIHGAQRSIDLTMFILGHDATGRAVVDALAERADQGVQVRLILDSVGCPRSRYYARQKLRKNAEVRLFMPLSISPIRGRTNLRSHRKLVVIDREHVFSGGMNFADEYMGSGPRDNGQPRWRDVAAVVRGPVALDGEAMFESDWAFTGGKRRGDAPFPVPQSGHEILQLVPSGPDLVTDTVYDLLLTAITEARSRVALVTPYYVPDDALQHALVLCARRGVRIDLVVPWVSNHRIADIARGDLLRELGAAGATVHYYPGGMVHAKAMVVDDDFAYVGSPNFDMRSFYLNYENALCVYSAGAIGQIRIYVDGLLSQCIGEGPPARWLALEQIARFLAPEL
ncbi:MAG TPA: phospholipase D-like domain-containing protein, partial [Polyangiaceae bacterium]|nr:phospholipase D-like domain-containing protein [Polyangiaceae bacterium]